MLTSWQGVFNQKVKPFQVDVIEYRKQALEDFSQERSSQIEVIPHSKGLMPKHSSRQGNYIKIEALLNKQNCQCSGSPDT